MGNTVYTCCKKLMLHLDLLYYTLKFGMRIAKLTLLSENSVNCKCGEKFAKIVSLLFHSSKRPYEPCY